jgi:hypothetical protein
MRDEIRHHLFVQGAEERPAKAGSQQRRCLQPAHLRIDSFTKPASRCSFRFASISGFSQNSRRQIVSCGNVAALKLL